jgi:hypothetical protein
MASLFTTAEEAQMRRYLGYPDLWRYKDTRLEGAMDTAGEDADAVALIRADLETLAEIDAKYVGKAASTAGIKRVDEIEFFGGGGDGTSVGSSLANLGRTIINRISITLGVPLYGDYYGKTGYPGDAFMGGVGGSGSNIIPLG